MTKLQKLKRARTIGIQATPIGSLPPGITQNNDIQDITRAPSYPAIISWLLLIHFMMGSVAYGQGSLEDYERAAGLRERFQDKVFRDRVEPNWLPDNTGFWYRLQTGKDTQEYVLVNAAEGRRAPAFDHQRLAIALIEAGVKEAQPSRLDLADLEFNSAEGAMTFRTDGSRWRVDLATYQLTKTDNPDTNQPARPWSELPRRSRSSGEETWITFVNTTDADVVLHWLNDQGQRTSYGTINPGQRHRQHTFTGHVWIAANEEGQDLAWAEGERASILVEVDAKNPRRERSERANRPERDENGDRSPDGQWSAFIRDHNVGLRNMESKEEFMLSEDGTATNGYRSRIFWAPNAQTFVAIRREDGDEREVTLVESSPKEQLQPKVLTYSYTKPGDRVAIDRPQLFEVATKKHIPVSDELFQNPWSIRDVRWANDSSEFTFLFNQRGHQVLRLLAVDATTGTVRVVVHEESPTFIDYAGKYFARWLNEGSELIWMSERDGWNHLYLYDAEKGSVKNQITRGPWVVRQVEHVDEENRQIWFQAGGIYPNQDPYFLHYARVNFDGTGLTLLTEGNGTHEVTFSPDRRFLIDSWSRVDQPPVTELRNAQTGQMICELEQADLSALSAAQWRAPEPFVANGRDGHTDIYGIIVRPTNFDPNQTYPVIEHIYAGPHSAFVPKSFRSFYQYQAMAELGFIVVKMDGMGTSYRSKAYHDVCWKNLGDGGFPDRMAWMKAAAAKYPQLDLSRVGIYGGSAGGQNALRAMLAHGDFYKAAAADCGCHDNRMDKIWWNELWMGWPIGPHYEIQSNVTQAHKLTGRLLLTVGELDRNVDPSSTMQVVDALIKADKDFEFLIVPGAGHGVGERPYAARRRADFFVRNLLGKEPRWTP